MSKEKEDPDNMSNMVPGRPRRQQQAYRRANTSLTLMSTNNLDSDPDPYISCSNILDKFNGNKDMANGSSPVRKSSGSGLKDFLLGRSSAARKESKVDEMNAWSVQESVIDDLRISAAPRQPKYSYLIGKAANKDDFWRKSNAVSIVNNNIYSSRAPQDGATAGNSFSSSSYYMPQHNSSSSKRLNDYSSLNNNVHSVQSAAYEDRISTALRKAPSSGVNYNSSANSIAAGNSSSAVQKSKSYSNFDFVRRDLNFQVCIRLSRAAQVYRCTV